MTLAELQSVIAATWGAGRRARDPSTVAWIAEEVGELAQAVRKGTRAQQSTSSATSSRGSPRSPTSSTSTSPTPLGGMPRLPRATPSPVRVAGAHTRTGWADRLTGPAHLTGSTQGERTASMVSASAADLSSR